jgi:hypothetical protein
MSRNDARDEDRIEDLSYTERRILFLQEQWIAQSSTQVPDSHQSMEHWLPPMEGWIKINIDGAFNKDVEICSGGVVLRNHHGGFVSGACHVFL